MTSAGQTSSSSPFVPSRRSVMRSAAWSVPVVSLAAAAPAFASSPDETPAELVTFTSSLFWRPTASEATAFGEGLYWGLSGIPDRAVMWATQITNTGTTAVDVQLDLGVPLDATRNKEFTVILAEGIAVAPAVFETTQRSADGRAVLTLPQFPANGPQTITTAILAPDSFRRGDAAAWPLTVTPPGGGSTVSLPITTYTEFREAVAP